MAGPAPNSTTAGAVNSFGGDNNVPGSCLDDPNFATICSFIQNFGEIIRIGRVPFDDLQQMLENTVDVPPPLVQLHITLLRRVFKSVTHDKWERSLAKFGHTYCSQDAWEVERFGYKKAKIQTKLRLLKNLLEAQFDYNVKFKAEVNKLQAADLRLTPLGRDTEGQVYWYQVDEDANLRVYREDIDDETWEIVASSRDELEELISQLQRGEVKKPEPEEAIILPEEDSNSKDDIEPKEIILDTGKVEESDGENSSESDEIEDEKQEKRTVEPLIIKHSFNFSKIQTSDEVDKVKSDTDTDNTISESEPKVPGIKMVFGMKSRPKNDHSVNEVGSMEVKSCSVEEATLSDNLVKKETPVDLTPSVTTPAHQSELLITEPQIPVNITVDEKKVDTPDVLVKPPKSETMPVEAKSTKFSGIFQSELSSKVELQAKASKNLQKSAKVNSIVARLNKNLPDQSAKTVADLLPPPEISKSESKPPRLDIQSVTEMATKAFAKEDNTSLPSACKIEAKGSPSIQTEHVALNLGIKVEPDANKTTLEKQQDSSSKPTINTSTSLTKEKPSLFKEKNLSSIQDDGQVRSDKKTTSSITQNPGICDQVLITKESVFYTEAKTLEIPKALDESTELVHDLSTTVKDKKSQPIPSAHQEVPMDVDEVGGLQEPAVPVVEPILKKQDAWICGRQETPPVSEKPVVRENTWICGNQETPVSEKPMLKENAWICSTSGQLPSSFDKLESKARTESQKSSMITSHFEHAESASANLKEETHVDRGSRKSFKVVNPMNESTRLLSSSKSVQSVLPLEREKTVEALVNELPTENFPSVPPSKAPKVAISTPKPESVPETSSIRETVSATSMSESVPTAASTPESVLIAPSMPESATAKVSIPESVPKAAEIPISLPTAASITDSLISTKTLLETAQTEAAISESLPKAASIPKSLPNAAEIPISLPTTASIPDSVIPTEASFPEGVPKSTEIPISLPTASISESVTSTERAPKVSPISGSDLIVETMPGNSVPAASSIPDSTPAAEVTSVNIPDAVKIPQSVPTTVSLAESVPVSEQVKETKPERTQTISEIIPTGAASESISTAKLQENALVMTVPEGIVETSISENAPVKPASSSDVAAESAEGLPTAAISSENVVASIASEEMTAAPSVVTESTVETTPGTYDSKAAAIIPGNITSYDKVPSTVVTSKESVKDALSSKCIPSEPTKDKNFSPNDLKDEVDASVSVCKDSGEGDVISLSEPLASNFVESSNVSKAVDMYPSKTGAIVDAGVLITEAQAANVGELPSNNEKSTTSNKNGNQVSVNQDESNKVQATLQASEKLKSSLVSALYSESSESSNEGFIIDTSVGSGSSLPSNPNQFNKGGDEALKTFAKSTQDSRETTEMQSSKLKNGSTSSLVKPDNSASISSTLSATLGLNNPSPNSSSGNSIDLKDIKDTTTLPTTSTDSMLMEASSTESGKVQASESGVKRKAEGEVESASKLQRLDDTKKEEEPSGVPEKNFNPIVGETVEEEVMTITGEGSGALNEGGNSPFFDAPFNPICGETIEEEIMIIIGAGSGLTNQGSNENSPVSLNVPENTGSQNESVESDEGESRDAFPKSRGRGGRRGRGRRGRPAAASSGGRNSQSSSTPRNNNRGSRGSREVARLGISLDSTELNGENERPVRASRRIAQIRLKEEEERRKLEEERLAQLKAAQIQKKAKQEERERKNAENETLGIKTKKGAGRKSQKSQQEFVADYIPSASESEDNDEDDEDDGSDEFSGKIGKGGKRKRRRKNGKTKKGGNPWATSDEDEEEEQVEEEEEYHEEEEEEELVFKSDHEFSPESDLGEDGDVGPSRHARTAKQDKGDLFEEGNCCKCRKGDHPEWILLCDKCDNGWHASCLRPQLWYIPEGEWFCPPCQHKMLIENLSKNLVEYESLLKKRENEILRKQRLAYVGISLDNVLPDKEPEVAEAEVEFEKLEKEKKRQRRRILSDEELSDDFINDNSNDDLSRSRSGSSDEDSDEPVYRLRARRTKKAFDFKEYDDMINSALRVDDDDEGGEKMDQEAFEEDGESQLNGEEEEEEADKGAGGGKNEAYLKHLEKQAQEEDETDEELLDEKERLRRKELKKHGQRKTRRRINDLDAYSEEEDSDDDFKASEAEDEDEELAEDGESDWSGDKMEEDSDDSIAKRARRKDRQGRHGRLGRREKYSDKGLVRRSTRKRRSRISYDESDDEDEEDDANDKWQSDESEEEEEEESESNSESDDATWGRKKKKGFAAAKPKLSDFVLGGGNASSKGKGKGGVKRKKRKTDNDDTDRAWNSARGKKDKDEPIERRTRGRKINFKDILDSGESDDDGNVRPKRRPLSDSDDSRSPSSSRKLAEEIRAENARREKEYEEAKKAEVAKLKSDEKVSFKDVAKSSNPSTMPESLAIAKLAESSVMPVAVPPVIKPSSPPVPVQLPLSVQASYVTTPLSPNSIPPVSSPLSNVSSPPIVVASMQVPINSSPVHPRSVPTPPISLPSTIANVSSPRKDAASPSLLPKSPPHIPYIPKTLPSNSSPIGPIPSSISRGPTPVNMVGGPIPSSLPSRLIPHNITGAPMPANLPGVPLPVNIPGGPIPSALSLSLQKPIPPPVPVPIIEKKPPKQSKGSRGSRGSKSEKSGPPPPPPVLSPDLELALSKHGKSPTLSSSSSSSSSKSSKKKDRDRADALTVPNPSLLLSGVGGVLPELLGVGLPTSLRTGQGIPGSPPVPSSGSSKKSKSSSGSSSARATQQTTPPPVSQNLSPSIPIDIDRVPNPAMFQGNPGIRPFHPIWGVRNPGPPPTSYGQSGGSGPAGLGKPPPLNSSPFSGQPSRPGFPSPPPLRIPNPNTSPLQAFQHFKRDGPIGGPLYRLPPGQPQPGVPLANILPPGIMSPHAGVPERFFGAPAGYPHPYGLLPPHSQGPPQALFPYDYRPPEPPFKDEPAPPRTTSSSLPTPVSSSSSSPPPTAPVAVPLSTKDEGSSARDSEFGGLVSYFSSQRSEEDMDT